MTTPVEEPGTGAVSLTAEDLKSQLAEADRLMKESDRLGHEADLVLARAEIARTVRDRQIDLEHAEVTLTEFMEAMAEAQEAYNPVAAELTEVERRLENLDTESGDLDTRLTAGGLEFALLRERERLAPQAAMLYQNLKDAQQQVTDLEDSTLAPARRKLEVASRALENPPLDNLEMLIAVAPAATAQRIDRIGLHLLLGDPGGRYTGHGSLIRAGVVDLLKATGLYKEIWGDLFNAMPAPLAARVQHALDNPPRPAPSWVPPYQGHTG